MVNQIYIQAQAKIVLTIRNNNAILVSKSYIDSLMYKTSFFNNDGVGEKESFILTQSSLKVYDLRSRHCVGCE